MVPIQFVPPVSPVDLRLIPTQQYHLALQLLVEAVTDLENLQILQGKCVKQPNLKVFC